MNEPRMRAALMGREAPCSNPACGSSAPAGWTCDRCDRPLCRRCDAKRAGFCVLCNATASQADSAPRPTA
jgi:hypothetical protein